MTTIYEANAELILAGPPTEPLAEHKLKGADPLQVIDEAMAGARDEWYERAQVCFDVIPVPNERARRLRSYWLNKAGAKSGYEGQDAVYHQATGQDVKRSQDKSRLASKLDPKEILFEL